MPIRFISLVILLAVFVGCAPLFPVAPYQDIFTGKIVVPGMKERKSFTRDIFWANQYVGKTLWYCGTKWRSRLAFLEPVEIKSIQEYFDNAYDRVVKKFSLEDKE